MVTVTATVSDELSPLDRQGRFRAFPLPPVPASARSHFRAFPLPRVPTCARSHFRPFPLAPVSTSGPFPLAPVPTYVSDALSPLEVSKVALEFGMLLRMSLGDNSAAACPCNSTVTSGRPGPPTLYSIKAGPAADVAGAVCMFVVACLDFTVRPRDSAVSRMQGAWLQQARRINRGTLHARAHIHTRASTLVHPACFARLGAYRKCRTESGSLEQSALLM